MEIIIDSKEKQRTSKAKKYYKIRGHDTIIDNLEYGDYLFNNKVVFEYKTITDFIGSTIDNRVFRQAHDQSTEYPYHFVIIEGNLEEVLRKVPQVRINNDSRVTRSIFDGAKRRLRTYTQVIECPTMTACFYEMLKQSEKCLKPKSNYTRTKPKSCNAALNFLLNIKYVNNYKANRIVQALNLECLTDLLSLNRANLCSVDGVGEKTADLILKNIRKQ